MSTAIVRLMPPWRWKSPIRRRWRVLFAAPGRKVHAGRPAAPESPESRERESDGVYMPLWRVPNGIDEAPLHFGHTPAPISRSKGLGTADPRKCAQMMMMKKKDKIICAHLRPSAVHGPATLHRQGSAARMAWSSFLNILETRLLTR